MRPLHVCIGVFLFIIVGIVINDIILSSKIKSTDTTNAFKVFPGIHDIIGNAKPITSFISSDMTNKQWMKLFSVIKHDHTNNNHLYYEQECNEYNWMDGLYESYIPTPKWKYYENTKILTNKQFKQNINKHINKTIILIMDNKNDLNRNIQYNLSDLSTFKEWSILGDSSLLIRRVFDTDDIDLFGRFIEWLWAKQWMGHIRNDPRCTPQNDHCRDIVLRPVRIENVACWKCGCIIEKQTFSRSKVDEYNAIIKNETFYQLAIKEKTDKVRFHAYHKLYNKYLKKYYHINKGIFLEIGLGCNMDYGPGSSANIWTKLFNNIHFIEYDRECTVKHQDKFENAGYHVHIGSQDDHIFLEELKEIYWNYLGLDIVIDDGGHWNKHIISSFLSLWPMVNRNGYYFVEDFQESAYIIGYADSKPITSWGGEQPGTAQYFIKKQLLYNLFCHITKRSCYDLKYIECIENLCVFQKRS